MAAKDGIEAVVRWGARTEIERVLEPRTFRSSEPGDSHKIIGATDHRADGDDHNIDQWVGDRTTYRIGEPCKMILNTHRLSGGHWHDSFQMGSADACVLSKRRRLQLPKRAKLPNMAQSRCAMLKSGSVVLLGRTRVRFELPGHALYKLAAVRDALELAAHAGEGNALAFLVEQVPGGDGRRVALPNPVL